MTFRDLIKLFRPKSQADYLAHLKTEIYGIRDMLDVGQVAPAHRRVVHLAAAMDEIELQIGDGDGVEVRKPRGTAASKLRFNPR